MMTVDMDAVAVVQTCSHLFDVLVLLLQCDDDDNGLCFLLSVSVYEHEYAVSVKAMIEYMME